MIDPPKNKQHEQLPHTHPLPSPPQKKDKEEEDYKLTLANQRDAITSQKRKTISAEHDHLARTTGLSGQVVALMSGVVDDDDDHDHDDDGSCSGGRKEGTTGGGKRRRKKKKKERRRKRDSGTKIDRRKSRDVSGG